MPGSCFGLLVKSYFRNGVSKVKNKNFFKKKIATKAQRLKEEKME